MESPQTEEEDVIGDIHDPVIKMTDPLLEVIIPADEATVFAALRYNDTEMVERLLRQGFDINFTQGEGKQGGKSSSCVHAYTIYCDFMALNVTIFRWKVVIFCHGFAQNFRYCGYSLFIMNYLKSIF